LSSWITDRSQIGFIDAIVQPLFRVLDQVIPELEISLCHLSSNRSHFERLLAIKSGRRDSERHAQHGAHEQSAQGKQDEQGGDDRPRQAAPDKAQRKCVDIEAEEDGIPPQGSRSSPSHDAVINASVREENDPRRPSRSANVDSSLHKLPSSISHSSRARAADVLESLRHTTIN